MSPWLRRPYRVFDWALTSSAQGTSHEGESGGKESVCLLFLNLFPVGLGCRRKEGGSLLEERRGPASLYSFECRSLVDYQSASVFLTQPRFTACVFPNAFGSQSWESLALGCSHLGPSCRNEGNLCLCMRLQSPEE